MMAINKNKQIMQWLLLAFFFWLPIAAHAEVTWVTIGDLQYDIDTDKKEAAVRGMAVNSIHNLVIPDYTTYEGVDYPVTEIKRSAFNYKTNSLTGTLTIGNYVKTIGKFAFGSYNSGCCFTGNLIIPNSVTTIEECAFGHCSGFTGDLIIPNSVTTIEEFAFSHCSGFTGNLIIPNSITTIGRYAFGGCSGFTGDLIIPNSVTTIGEGAFGGCHGFNGTLTIGNSVTTIGVWAFQDCDGFTGPLIIPNSVTTISQGAFEYCYGFNALTLGNSVVTIEYSAFGYCNGFTGPLEIPNTVETIGGHAFYQCSGFTGSLTIPNSVTTIGNAAFMNCVGFNGTLTIGNSVTTIGGYAFDSCGGFIGPLTIPNSVTTIGEFAFEYCKGFTGALTIGNSVTLIDRWAFTYCNGFTELYLPASLETIGTYGLAACNALETITCDALIPPSILKYIINGSLVGDPFSSYNYEKTTLIVPAESVEKYKSAEYWKNFFRIEPAGDNPVTRISLDKTSAQMIVDEDMTLVATIVPEEATDKTVTWASSDSRFATVDENGKVIAISPGKTTITATTSNGLSATCEVTVIPYMVDAGSAQVTVSDEKIRENNIISVSTNQPQGGYDNGWTYRWTLDGREVSTEREFGLRMPMAPGNEKAKETHVFVLNATNLAPEGSVYGEFEKQSEAVTVYRRPQTPKQLLKKGTGSSKTLICMMEPNDSELTRLGYGFVYGYTDANGEDHVLTTTAKRYYQMNANVFDNAIYRKWCYAVWTYDDGSVVSSGKCYIDEQADEDFDASDFHNTGNARTRNYTSSANWISVAQNCISINVDATSDTHIDVYTANGVKVRTETVHTGASGSMNIHNGELAAGVYIISVTSATEHVSKKVTIK